MVRCHFNAFILFFLSLFLSGSGEVLALDLKPESSLPDEGSSPKVLCYEMKGVIHGGTVEILNGLFKRGASERFDALFIQMDTPGGLLDSTEDIVKLFLNSDIPIIVYVAPRGARAGSAGTFITMAAHVAAMAPGTYIGAAHPVSLFGGGGEGESEDAKQMRKKIESATSTYITAIAEQRGRNEEWAKKAVLESESLTADKALEMRVIDLVSDNQEELLKKINGRLIKLTKGEVILNTTGVSVVSHEPGWRLRFLNVLASPTLIYLLILGVLAGIYLEASHPGAIFPGIVAGICLVLALMATRILPINALGVLLILAAIGLLIAEIYVTSFGLLTVAAIISFFFGSLLLFDPMQTEVSIPISYALASSLGLAVIAVIIGYASIKTFLKPQYAGVENLLQKTAIVEDALFPGKIGKVVLCGEYWNAESDEEIKKGVLVKIITIKGLKVFVKPNIK